MWTPMKGGRNSTRDGKKRVPSSKAEGRADERDSNERTLYTTRAQEAQHNRHQHKHKPTPNTQPKKPSKKGDTGADSASPMEPVETRPHTGLTPPPTPAAQ
eukprot:scaffold122448_cov32-Tisochrysis_lutea.AAC.1